MQRPAPLHGYRRRNQNLLRLGYSSYQEYLNSDLWRNIKYRVYKECGNKCLLCENRAVVIHHNGYALNTLSGKDLHMLKPLCHECHQNIEFDENGQKRSLRATRRLEIRLHKKVLKEQRNFIKT